jgi:DNA polymerase
VTAWATLAEQIVACTACSELAPGRTTVVVGDRPRQRSRLALVGEAPGAAEDAAGRPFVGRAGQLLDQLLAEAGLNRAEVAVLNTVKCRPPGNRAPKPAELANCAPFLHAQLGLLRPELVVALGLTAVRWFLGNRTGLAAARGTVHQVHGYRVIATYHPSAAIRFGPAGAPLAALREDLASAVKAMA